MELYTTENAGYFYSLNDEIFMIGKSNIINRNKSW